MREAIQRHAEYFELRPGYYPAQEAIAALKETSLRTRLQVRIVRAEMGNYGDHRRLDGDLLELREDQGPGYRIYIGEKGTQLLLILAAGDKKGQDKDIQTAQEYWTAYKQRERRLGHAT